MSADPFEPSRDEIRIPVPFSYARAAVDATLADANGIGPGLTRELLLIGTTDLGMWELAFMEATHASGKLTYWATFRRADLPD